MADPERTDNQDEAREKEIGESRQKLALAAVPLLFTGLVTFSASKLYHISSDLNSHIISYTYSSEGEVAVH
jgi:hypothetical protein